MLADIRRNIQAMLEVTIDVGAKRFAGWLYEAKKFTWLMCSPKTGIILRSISMRE